MKLKCQVLKLFAVLSVGVVFWGCSKESERDKIGEAQNCLDQVTSANPDLADTCSDKVATISSKSADGIRCSAAFVKEGFTDATTLISTFSTISNGLGSTSLASFLGLIVFDGRSATNLASTAGATAYYTAAKTASTYCASAGLKVGTLITTFSFLGNSLIKLACDAPGGICGSTMFDSINTQAIAIGAYLISSPSVANQIYSDLGTLVINSYLISCVGSTTNKTLCDSITQAVNQSGGVSNSTTVGKKFIGNLLGVSL